MAAMPEILTLASTLTIFIISECHFVKLNPRFLATATTSNRQPLKASFPFLSVQLFLRNSFRRSQSRQHSALMNYFSRFSSGTSRKVVVVENNEIMNNFGDGAERRGGSAHKIACNAECQSNETRQCFYRSQTKDFQKKPKIALFYSFITPCCEFSARKERMCWKNFPSKALFIGFGPLKHT